MKQDTSKYICCAMHNCIPAGTVQWGNSYGNSLAPSVNVILTSTLCEGHHLRCRMKRDRWTQSSNTHPIFFHYSCHLTVHVHEILLRAEADANHPTMHGMHVHCKIIFHLVNTKFRLSCSLIVKHFNSFVGKIITR